MAASGEYVFSDIDDYVGAVVEARLELLYNSPGIFRACLARASLPHLHLLTLQENLSRSALVSSSSQRVVVAFPLHERSSLILSGVKLRGGEMVFLSSGEQLYQRTHGPLNWGLLSMEPEYCCAVSRVLTGVNFLPRMGQVLRPDHRAMLHLLQQHSAATTLGAQQPQLIMQPEVARGMENDLIEALVSCLVSGRECENLVDRRHKRIMDKMAELIAERPMQVSVRELSTALGVSERTLRSCCAEYLGISPVRYLRFRRLRLARIALLRAKSVSTSVAEVARYHGFSELGRFAAAYKRAFGELPSVTLQRVQTERKDHDFFRICIAI